MFGYIFLFYFINIIIVCLHSDESDISDYAQIDQSTIVLAFHLMLHKLGTILAD